MKVFFDTTVYVAEALLGAGAEQMVQATIRASWRIFATDYLLGEVERVLTEKLGFPRRLALLTCRRIIRRSEITKLPTSRHQVPRDPKDSPILQAALASAVDYLVTNDSHLLDLHPYQGLQIISMTDYHQLLANEGLISKA